MLVVVIALNGATVALAQDQDGRQACINDAFQFCQDAIPDRERVFQCLVSHKDLISAACHAVIASSLPVDQPPLEKQAPHKKSAKGKATIAKRATTTVARNDRHAPHAKSTKGKAIFVKRASKAVSRHDRHPLNLVPH
jgi:hypothetical protein